ncbi:MAG TPA: galactokinase family protein [Patescibacteria group bacterium]|nr:galactokinase family protein [Patescibacteria group bacterium]
MNAEIVSPLLAAGLTPAEADRKADLFRLAGDRLAAWIGKESEAAIRCYVPGRIEVLGKHTDYAGGRSLLCAVERGICAVAAPRRAATIRIADAVRRQDCEFPLSPELDPQSDHWPLYPKTVARRMARNFSGPLRGMDMAFASDLPRASGMSSSSALLVCTWLLLERSNELEHRPEFCNNIHTAEDKASYLACVENGQTFGTLAGDAGVGTYGGSEDHTAILCSRPGMLRQYAFCPTRHEADVHFPPEFSFLIAVCGVAADKTGAAREQYNRASGAAAEILRIWRESTGRGDASLFRAAVAAGDARERIRQELRKHPSQRYTAESLLDRFDQLVEECGSIIPEAVSALRVKDLEKFGSCVDRSQTLAEQKLGNQIPQTAELARSARRLGALAASAFGAGFGGSVWAMARADEAADLLKHWQQDYRRQFPVEAERSTFFTSGAGPAAILF